MTEKTCPHCGHDVKERWHQSYGVQKFERGTGEIGVPVVGKVLLKKETLVMVYICEITNLPFLVTLSKAK